MKKRKIIFISGILILSQGVLPYESILLDFTIHEELKYTETKRLLHTSAGDKGQAAVQFFTEKPKKKRTDFTPIEKNITLLRQQALNNDEHRGSSEFGKIVSVVSGTMLYGSVMSKELTAKLLI
jgi:hypothetical protein